MQTYITRLCAIILLIQLTIISSTAQDSLLHLLTTTLPDTTRIDVLGKLSKTLLSTNTDQAIAYAQEAVDLSTQVGDAERSAYMLKSVGLGYYYKGEFVEVLDYWRASLEEFKKINHPKGISNLLSNIGAVYSTTGDYTKALEYHLEALRIAEKQKDDFRRATVLQNLGAVYSNNGQFELSKTYYQQAMTICQSIDYQECIGLVSLNLSEVYENMENLPEAVVWMKKAKEIMAATKSPMLSETLAKSSNLKIKEKKFEAALQEAKSAYDLAASSNNKTALQMSLIVLGNIYTQTLNEEQAIYAFQESIQLGKKIGINNNMQVAYKGLIDAYRNKGNFLDALTAQDSLESINQTIYDLERDKKLSNLQLEFDLEKREAEIALLNADNALKNQQIAKAKVERNFLTAIAAFLFLLIGGIGYLYQYSQKKNKIISEERNKSDHLLKNILPPETAEELKKNGVVQPKSYEEITVLFTDFVGFTKKAASNSPEIIVSSIDYYFKEFDKIISDNQLEKIKTMGDAYMCAGGLHIADNHHGTITKNTIKAAFQILQFVKQTAANPPLGIVPFQIRIGIDSGPVVAGVVGQSKFQYDIWGDTVNVAARMEANSEPNKINVSENIYQQLKDSLEFLYRGTIDVKNKGLMKMYFYEST